MNRGSAVGSMLYQACKRRRMGCAGSRRYGKNFPRLLNLFFRAACGLAGLNCGQSRLVPAAGAPVVFAHRGHHSGRHFPPACGRDEISPRPTATPAACGAWIIPTAGAPAPYRKTHRNVRALGNRPIPASGSECPDWCGGLFGQVKKKSGMWSSTVSEGASRGPSFFDHGRGDARRRGSPASPRGYVISSACRHRAGV